MKTPNLPTSFVDLFLCLFIVFQVLSSTSKQKNSSKMNYYIVSLTLNNHDFIYDEMEIRMIIDGEDYLRGIQSSDHVVRWHEKENALSIIINADRRPQDIGLEIGLKDDNLSAIGFEELEGNIAFEGGNTAFSLARKDFFKKYVKL